MHTAYYDLNTKIKQLENNIYKDIMRQTILLKLTAENLSTTVHDTIFENVFKAILESAMLMSQSNQSEAARLLGISRGTLRKHLSKKFGKLDVGMVSKSEMEDRISCLLKDVFS